MKPEYDFSKAERGKFFRPDAELRFPIYLNPDIQAYLAERAPRKHSKQPSKAGNPDYRIVEVERVSG